MTETEKQLKKVYSAPTAIEEMYAANLQSQKAGLEADHAAADANLTATQQKQQAATDAALTRTAVEGQQAVMNNAQLNAAYGLSSGAAAQARISQENQISANLTALRAAQLEADAGIEQQRTLLGQQLSSAIRQAQSENDMEKAKALYEYARQEEERLEQKRLDAATLLSNAGDFSLMGQIYGLTPQQVSRLNNAANAAGATNGGISQADLDAAKLMAEAGDYSRYAQLYGLNEEETALLNGTKPQGDDKKPQNTGGNSGNSSNASNVKDDTPTPTKYSEVEQQLQEWRAKGMSKDVATSWLTEAVKSGVINQTQMQFLLAKYHF